MNYLRKSPVQSINSRQTEFGNKSGLLTRYKVSKCNSCWEKGIHSGQILKTLIGEISTTGK